MAFILNLQKQYLEYVASLFNQEIVDKQFADVMNLKENSPTFPATMVAVFYRDSDILINSISEVVEHPIVNFDKVYELAQTLRGCSITIGAVKITNLCAGFHQLCKDNNVEMLKQYVQHLQNERSSLKNKLDTLLRLRSQILAAGGMVPVIKLKPVVRNFGGSGRV